MNKRPIVYTIRELLTYDDEYNSCLIGYFVSRAYIAHLDITYHKTGAAVKKYDIDFCDMVYTNFNSSPVWFAENGSKSEVYQSKIFKDYASCKKYVDGQNSIYFTQNHTTMPRRIELHKQALKYCKVLEEKYIPAEEREKISEDVKNY
ncbi:MAG: hypothetical protein IJA72_02045 [Clostridia bacterium]|nr:hypothetical protein [Clostridia bacterium]